MGYLIFQYQWWKKARWDISRSLLANRPPGVCAHRCGGWQGPRLACIWACLPPVADESLIRGSSARGWAVCPFQFLLSAWQFFLFCARHQKRYYEQWKSAPGENWVLLAKLFYFLLTYNKSYLFISKNSFLFGSKIFLNSATKIKQKRIKILYLVVMCSFYLFMWHVFVELVFLFLVPMKLW